MIEKGKEVLTTPIGIWLHPYRTLRRIGELREALSAAESARREAQDIAVRQAADNSKALEENADKRAELAEKLRLAEERIQELERENRKQAEQIEEYGDVETAMKEFDARLSGFESVKKSYEHKISNLRRQLEDANRRLTERGAQRVKEPETIDMTQKRNKPKEKDPASWFRPLPDNL